jgi:hypothetical protein
MVKLSDFRSDTKAIQDGVWVRVDERNYGDLEILSRGSTDEFIDASADRWAKAAEKYGGDRSRIPNSEGRKIQASLFEDYLILDVRNLSDDDGNPVDVRTFHAMLYDPQFQKLSNACRDAVAKVNARQGEQTGQAEKNSVTPSQPHLNGATSVHA